MKEIIQFGAFQVDLTSGLLCKEVAENEVQEIRLAPQPTQLLKLLLDTYPNVLSQETIKAALWPDTKVGFENSLHYCVRQLRSAFDEKAAQPVYIETVPKRGYRWLVAWKVIEAKNVDKQIGKHQKRSNWLRLGFLFLIVCCALAMLPTAISPRVEAKLGPDRIAIMPLQPTDSTHPLSENGIAFMLLEKLNNQGEIPLEVIGPTSTHFYAQDQLRQLIQEYEIDVLINAKFLVREAQEIILVEIIRATDGAHVWVCSYPVEVNEVDLVKEVLDGFQEIIK